MKLIKYFFLIIFIPVHLFPQDKASTIHFDVNYQKGMEKCAYYIVSHLEKNYKLQSEKLKFEISDPVQVYLVSGGDPCRKTGCSDKSIYLNFRGSYNEMGEDALYQLSCILLTSMKRDDLLINKISINDLPAWIKRGYSFYASSVYRKASSPSVWSRLEAAKKNYTIAGSQNDEDFPAAAVSFFRFMDEAFPAKFPLFFREFYYSGNVSSAFRKIYGKTENELIEIWIDSINIKELNSSSDMEKPDRCYIFNKNYFVSVSPDGDAASYIENNNLMIRFLKDGSEKSVFIRNMVNESGFPVWHPDSGIIIVPVLKNKYITLVSYDLKTEKISDLIKLPFQAVSDLKIYADKKYIFTGYSDESSDIYIYDSLSDRLLRITSDHFDKKFPALADDNIMLYFSNENMFHNPFSLKYSLFLFDIRKREKIKIFDNIDSPSAISAAGKDKIALSFEIDGIDSVYLFDIKSAVLRSAVKTALNPCWSGDGSRLFYFKIFNSKKILERKIYTGIAAEPMREMLKKSDLPDNPENRIYSGEVVYDTD